MANTCILLVALVICSVPCFAQDDANGPTKKLWGVDFGIGIATIIDALDRLERAEAAELVINESGEAIVKVTKERNVTARVIFETHYFFPKSQVQCRVFKAERTGKTKAEIASLKAIRRGSPECHQAQASARYGWGPFLAVQPGSENVIEAVGMGVMLGLRRHEKPRYSFNVGLGLITEPKVKTLQAGFRDNMRAPTDDMGVPREISFREADQTGVVVLASFTF